jgi:hypothetical protein
MRVSPIGEAVPTAGFPSERFANANANVGFPDGLATQIALREPQRAFGSRQRNLAENCGCIFGYFSKKFGDLIENQLVLGLRLAIRNDNRQR